MVTESEILGLRARIAELEQRLDFLYNRLGITYAEDQGVADTRVSEALKKGNKIEAIKIYRETHNCGLAEAKQAVDDLERRMGF